MLKLIEALFNLVAGGTACSVGCVTFILLGGMALLPILVILALL